MFAKLFETEVGQVLVTKDTNDDYNPCIRFTFESEYKSRISISCDYEDDSDESFEKRDKAFDEMEEEQALGVAKSILKDFSA